MDRWQPLVRRRRPQKYPIELRERAVRIWSVRSLAVDAPGVIGRIAKQLGIGTESLRIWVKQAEIDEGHKPGISTADAQRIFELNARTVSCAAPTKY